MIAKKRRMKHVMEKRMLVMYARWADFEVAIWSGMKTVDYAVSDGTRSLLSFLIYLDFGYQPNGTLIF